MMKTTLRIAAAISALVMFGGTAAAQQAAPPETGTEATPATDPKAATPPADLNWLKGRPIVMQHFRPLDLLVHVDDVGAGKNGGRGSGDHRGGVHGGALGGSFFFRLDDRIALDFLADLDGHGTDGSCGAGDNDGLPGRRSNDGCRGPPRRITPGRDAAVTLSGHLLMGAACCWNLVS